MSETTNPSVLTVDLPAPELPKGEREYQAFLRLLPELLATHEGRFVAVHNEEVVDSDTDEAALILRVRATVGHVPLYVGLVTQQQPVLRIPHYHEHMPHRSWTLLDSREIAQYPILRLREDRYRFEPTGAESRFIVCDTADWAMIIPTTPDGRLILVRQYRHGVREDVLEVPGGVLDSGESPEEAARRELREETGYEAGRLRYLGKMLPNPAINNARLHVVLAEDCRYAGAPQWDPFEQIEVVLRPIQDVPAMIRSGEIAHALVIAAFALIR